MNKFSLVRLLASLVCLTSIIVMLGWIFDIGILKSILPHWVTMKFTTALSFLLSGLVLLAITNVNQHLHVQSGIFLLAMTMGILLLMSSLLASSLLGIHTGIENWFVEDAANAVKTVTPGMPSIGTMGAFIVISLTGLFAIMGPLDAMPLLLAGAIEGGLSVTALLGYLLEIPPLYYHIEGISTAMAIHTAILFAILGLGLLMLGTIRERKAA